MGLLRFVFALSIVVFHAYPGLTFNLAITRIAVPAFFVMSGYTISMVLKEKYIGKNGSYRLFLTNRLLRIYPVYWFVLLSFFFFSLIKYTTHIGNPDNAFNHLIANGKDLPLYFLANLTLFPLGPLWFELNKELRFLVGPQIWAIQLEIFFYIIAPLLIKLPTKKSTAVMIMALFIIYYFNLPARITVPVFALFASHFIYFCIGIAIYFIFKRLPAVFFWSRLLGNLAYPLFISHIFFIKLAKNIVPTENMIVFTVVVVAMTLLGSYVLWRYVEEPVNRFRQSRLTPL